MRCQVLEGQVYLSPSMSGQLLDRLSRSPSKSNVSLSYGAADGQGIENFTGLGEPKHPWKYPNC